MQTPLGKLFRAADADILILARTTRIPPLRLQLLCEDESTFSEFDFSEMMRLRFAMRFISIEAFDISLCKRRIVRTHYFRRLRLRPPLRLKMGYEEPPQRIGFERFRQRIDKLFSDDRRNGN